MPKVSWQQIDATIVRLCGVSKGRIGFLCSGRMRLLRRSPRPWVLLLARHELAALAKTM